MLIHHTSLKDLSHYSETGNNFIFVLLDDLTSLKDVVPIFLEE